MQTEADGAGRSPSASLRKEGVAGRFIFDPRYAEAVLHVRGGHRVLGRRLRPFSLWHKLQLEYANSPLLTGGRVDLPDLELAVLICRTRYPDFAEYRAARSWWARWWWLVWSERWDLRRERGAFAAYLADYYSAPKLWEQPKKKGGRSARRDVDDSISEVVRYRALFASSREEPWDMPYGELVWMNICGLKAKGEEIRVRTPADEKAFAEHLKVREATIARLAEEFAEKEGLSPEEAKKRAHAHYWEVVKRNKAKRGFV